jgi:hypothetical protein
MKRMIFSRKPHTQAQIDKLFKLLGKRLQDEDLPREPLRHVLNKGGKDLIDAIVAVLINKVNAVTIFTRQFEMPLKPSWSRIMKASGRVHCVYDHDTITTMPKPEKKRVVIAFFNVGHDINDDQLDKEYKERGLIPIDPYSLAVANQLDPTLADKYPNATRWKNEKGKYKHSYVAFHSKPKKEMDNPSVYVIERAKGVWSKNWWFAGTLEKV